MTTVGLEADPRIDTVTESVAKMGQKADIGPVSGTPKMIDAPVINPMLSVRTAG